MTRMNVLQQLDLFFSSNGSLLFWLGAFFSIVYFLLMSKIRKGQKELKNAIRKMNDKSVFSEEFSILKEIGNELDLFDDNFQEYCESINENVLLPIDDYFDFYNLLERLTNRRLITTIPGILTACGILFTFIGLFASMSKINLTTVDSTKGSIAILMSGMSVAFVSSIIGIILSIIWNLVDKLYIRAFERRIFKFCQTFNRTMKVVYPTDQIAELVTLQKRQTRYFQTFAEDISLRLGDAISKSIDDVMAPRMETLVEQNQKLIESINGNQVQGMEKVVGKIFDEASDLLGEQMASLSGSIEDMINWQLKSREGMDKLVNQILELGEYQSEINKGSKEILDEYTRSVSGFTSIVSSLSDSLEQIENLKETIAQQSNLLSDYKIHIDSTLKASEANISKIKDMMTEFNASSKFVHDNMQNISGELEASSRVFSENLTSGLTRSFSAFDDNLAAITGKLVTVVKKSNDSLTELPDLMEDIRENIELFAGIIEEQVREENDVRRM